MMTKDFKQGASVIFQLTIVPLGDLMILQNSRSQNSKLGIYLISCKQAVARELSTGLHIADVAKGINLTHTVEGLMLQPKYAIQLACQNILLFYLWDTTHPSSF